MLTLRQRIFAISGIVIALVLGIVLVLVNRERPEDDETTIDSAEVIDATEATEPDFVDISETPEIIIPQNVDPDELLAKQITRIFVERFETYSNQNDNEHIEDASKLATANMVQWIASHEEEKSDEYKGAKTRVLSMSVTDVTDTRAVVEIAVQQELRTATSAELAQKKGRVELLKSENTWLVDGLFWE